MNRRDWLSSWTAAFPRGLDAAPAPALAMPPSSGDWLRAPSIQPPHCLIRSNTAYGFFCCMASDNLGARMPALGARSFLPAFYLFVL